jgi:xanthine dehydrogenase accessory factor
MRFHDTPVLIRGGGDLASGVAWRLRRAGFPVVITELAAPLTIRRSVAFSTAVTDGEVRVEGMRAKRVASPDDAVAVARSGTIAVLVDPGIPDVGAAVVVDARMAKRNLGTGIGDADLVVGLGPGFEAGVDCHAVVETKRGHRLGRALWKGSAEPNTGTPGTVGGRGADRVIHAPTDGTVAWEVSIGDVVAAGERMGSVGGAPIRAPFDGLVRGLIAAGSDVPRGRKIADVDSRRDPRAAGEISDKALAVGGGVLEAVLAWLDR